MALDHFTVTRNTTKTVLNAQGVLETVPANVPGFEFNPDGTYKGCLIEPSATNEVIFSNKLDGAGWFGDGDISVSENNFTIFKNQKSWVVTNNSAVTDNTRWARPISLPDNQYVLSCYVERNTADRFALLIQGLSGDARVFLPELGGDISVWVSPSGDYLAQGWENTGIVGLSGNNIFRYFVVIDTSSISSGNIRITRLPTENSINIYQVQCEPTTAGANARPSSPIITTDSTATRNADEIVRENAQDLIGQDSGKITIEATIREFDADRRLLTISDGTDSNLLALELNDNVLSVTKDTTTGLIPTATLEAGTYRIELEYSTSEIKLTVNDTEIGTSATDGSGTYDQIDVAQSESGDEQLNDHVRLLAIEK